MKRKSTSQSAFFNLRVLLASVFCLAGIFVALVGAGLYSAPSKAQAQAGPASPVSATANSPGAPDIAQLVGPIRQDKDLRSLPYIAPAPQILQQRLTRYPRPEIGASAQASTSGFAQFSSLLEALLQPLPNMPPPLLTFDGINLVQGGCNCLPPDTNGDVGPNHYVQSVNVAFKVFAKSGNTLSGPTTFNSFFAPLGRSTPCGNNQNQGDQFVFYDQIADRWVVSDFAFPSFPGASFWQCIGVSQTGDPVSGGWFLYAVQVDPANTRRLGDYPKLALWHDAYYLTMNEFTNNTTFNGVRVYALDRASMINGDPANAVGFTIGLAGVGDSYSLVPAGFRAWFPRAFAPAVRRLRAGTNFSSPSTAQPAAA